ncbi:FadD3 family acyl-CoA ligase [Streptomyces sp. 4F14]|uniref:FadD3 family acyl-CoA ligase n=1 Tax=Streptomyces sp. 4F14 TaxID=3394380 RepID=UPI003A83552F
MTTARSIPELVRLAADAYGDAEAVVDGELRLTFTALADQVARTAGAFASAGVRTGDRVALWAPNSAEWIVAALGILAAGAAVVPVNTRFRDEEAHDIVVRSGARLLLVQNGFLEREFTGPPGVRVIDLRKDDFLASGPPLELPVDGGDLADIIFTSGTTGRPKGVMTTHAQILRLYTEWCDLAQLRTGDRYLMVNPFFHIFGLHAGIVASLVRGATMLPVAVFDVARVLELVEREKVTVLPGPPTLYHSLLEAGRTRELGSLRVAVTGSADIPVELVRRITTELPFTHLMTGYGLTEAGTVTASRPGDSYEAIATTVGRPCAGVEVRIADDGEVLVRGYSVTSGYLDDPKATADAIDPQGWLHTGDLGELDAEGRLKIVGRKKDMFVVGGFNAYPAEIEGYLLRHPAVAQVAVVGVPDARMGEVGKAYVVPRAEVTEAALIAWAKERMAGFKVPRYIEFRTELPLTATGKVLKDQLR